MPPVQATLDEGYIVPVHSVGVQGDSRSYAPVFAIDVGSLDHARATELINRISGVNRVIACVRTASPLADLRVRVSALTPERLGAPAPGRRHRAPPLARQRVRPADLAVPGGADPARLRRRSGFRGAPSDRFGGWHDRAVRRHARAAYSLLSPVTLLSVPGISGVFYDLTHKPPATIEWE